MLGKTRRNEFRNNVRKDLQLSLLYLEPLQSLI